MNLFLSVRYDRGANAECAGRITEEDAEKPVLGVLVLAFRLFIISTAGELYSVNSVDSV